MPARFTVVDAQGATVNLAALVSARAETMSLDGTVSEDEFETPLLPEGVRLRATGLAVCSGFHFSASSHTGREMEADEAEGAAA